MLQVRRALSIFRVTGDDPELTLSRYHAVARQIPLLYAVLLVNMVACAATHIHTAPMARTAMAPAVFAIVGVVRIIEWRRRDGGAIDAATALRALRSSTRLAAVFAAVLVTWSISLFPYGDSFARVHVEFFVTITVIGCIACLMHLRPAALLVALIVVVPATTFFALTGQIVLIAIALNFLLVSICMMMVLIGQDRDFIALSDSRKELIARQAETQRLSDENFRLANIDTLTNLPNRRGFFRDVGATLDRHGATSRRVCVGLIDLDGFKPINDLFGHAAGDAVLHEVGRRLGLLASASLTFARLGGDEFGFVCSEGAESEILALADRLCRLLRVPYLMAQGCVEVSASIGLAVFPEAGRTASSLFERADYALYHAKQNQRGSPVMFSHRHSGEIHEAARLEQALRHADLEAELSVAFQPIFDCHSGRTVSFECLARWTSPELGVVPPSAFIKAAERSDMINRLTELLLRRALEAAADWPDRVGLSFNLSVRDIASEAAVRRISEIVKAAPVPPSRISFEITETAVMRDFDQARQALLALRGLGARIALDDFGTGYSSLSYVHRLPFDRIKVDRSFTADIETDPACRNIVKTVLDLCHNLDLGCVVEGLETFAQVDILQGLGCCLMQGYVFAPPMPGQAIRDFLAAEPQARCEAVPHDAHPARVLVAE